MDWRRLTWLGPGVWTWPRLARQAPPPQAGLHPWFCPPAFPLPQASLVSTSSPSQLPSTSANSPLQAWEAKWGGHHMSFLTLESRCDLRHSWASARDLCWPIWASGLLSKTQKEVSKLSNSSAYPIQLTKINHYFLSLHKQPYTDPCLFWCNLMEESGTDSI